MKIIAAVPTGNHPDLLLKNIDCLLRQTPVAGLDRWTKPLCVLCVATKAQARFARRIF